MGIVTPALTSEWIALDQEMLTALDTGKLRMHLEVLRVENDGTLNYQQAIAYLERFLAAACPDQTQLLANYPNPFNPETWIPYQLQ